MFTTDERAASYLKFNGIQFEYHDCVKYAELHPEWKNNNLGRRQCIDQDAVFDYACRMESGSAAPAVILMPQAEGLLVLDGVQRLMAGEENKLTSCCAYVCSKRTSLAKQHLVRVCSSGSINGQHTPDKMFLLETAVEILYFGDHCSYEEIARAIGTTVTKIQEEARFQTTSKKMESVGYDGKLLSRGSKWFVTMIGKYADATDWEIAPGPLREMLKTCEMVASKNGFLDPLMQEFFDVKRAARSDRHDQFTRKVCELKKAPEIIQKLAGGKGKQHLEHILPALRRVLCSLDKAVAADEIVHDKLFAQDLADCLRRVFARCRELVPRDLQYADDRRTSIFDKG
jgi:hypothetical protein